MNWIKVNYDGHRTVYVDGNPIGDTNETLLLGESGKITSSCRKSTMAAIVTILEDMYSIRT